MSRKNSFADNALFRFLGKSIQRKLILLLVAVGLLPMIAVAVSMYNSTSAGIYAKAFDPVSYTHLTLPTILLV